MTFPGITKTCCALAVVLLLGGCGGSEPDEFGPSLSPSGELTAEFRKGTWVPLRLSRESFLVAERRLRESVRIGMPRAEFLHVMKLVPISGVEGVGQLVTGEGWISELSRTNKVGDVEIEEFSFGYFRNFRYVERFVVIVRKGIVARIAHSPWAEGVSAARVPVSLLATPMTLEEETRRIKEFYHKRLQTESAFERILPQLKKVRVGWTSAEMRLALGGSLYQLPHGLVYFQEGLMWDQGFFQSNNAPVPVSILPFGYRDGDKVETKVVIRAEGGLVTAVFWKE